jgi:hypothetical protein
MQRRNAKIALRDHDGRQRPKDQNGNGLKSPRKGLFYAGLEICGLGGLVVEMKGTELPTPTQSSNRSLRAEPGTEFFDAETEGQKPYFRLAETDAETDVDSKGPRSAGQMHGYRTEFDTYGLGGGRDRDRTCDPLDVNEVLSR